MICITEVCRYCSDEPLSQVADYSHVKGVQVRLRLLVALLRLADQLYIDPSRVNIDLLERAEESLSQRQFARWWAYQYTQSLPITLGQIQFNYFLPSAQTEFLGFIRGLVEPQFKYENNSTIQYLWSEHRLRLMLNDRPKIGRYDPRAGLQREMSPSLLAYLRRNVNPIETPSEQQMAREEEVEEHTLLLLDYENLIVQLGRKGYFFAPDEISRLLVGLVREAGNQHLGPVDSVIVGHWARPYLASLASRPEARIYRFLTVGEQETPADKIEAEMTSRLSEASLPKQVILVAPPLDAVPAVRQWVAHGPTITAWDSDEADVYRAVTRHHKPLTQVLELHGATPLESQEIQRLQTMCILRLDRAMATAADGLALEEAQSLLDDVGPTTGQANWWLFWLSQQGIVSSGMVHGLPAIWLNGDHPGVSRVCEMRKAVATTLQELGGKEQRLPEDQLLAELKRLSPFRQEPAPKTFLDLLRTDEMLYVDARASQPDQQPLWSLNPYYMPVVALNAERYLPLLILAIDQVLLRDGHQFLHEHRRAADLGPYLGHNLVEPIYQLALARGWIRRSESDLKFRGSDQGIMNVGLVPEYPGVGETLRNAEIIVSFLSDRSAANGLERGALWQRLDRIQSFSIRPDEFDDWLKCLQRDGLVKIAGHDQDPARDVIKVEPDTSPLVQLMLGRMNVYGLIRTMRLCGANRPENKRPAEAVLEQVTRYVVKGNQKLATWTLKYAEQIRLVRAESQPGPSGTVRLLYLDVRHNLVRRLDNRESMACQDLAGLVKTISRGQPDGWLPRPRVEHEMDRYGQVYGFLRGEHSYWVEQAIHRLKLLEERRERGRNGWEFFVRPTTRL